MKTIEFDESRWPLVRIRFGKEVDEAEFDQLLALLDANIKRAAAARTKTALIYDSTLGYHASPRIRKKQADWMKQNSMQSRANCAGIAFVITASLVRGALTAILWLTDMPVPYSVVGTMQEAELFCTAQLAAHGIEVPDPLNKSRAS
jgi:hypothetical protein